MNKTMSQIAKAVSVQKNLSLRHYVVFNTDGMTGVMYRGTQVAAIDHRTRVMTLNNGGYFTPTTKNVINAALQGAGARHYVYQRDFSWYISVSLVECPFTNGFRLTLPTI